MHSQRDPGALSLCRHLGTVLGAGLRLERQYCSPNSPTDVRCLYIASQAIEVVQEKMLRKNCFVYWLQPLYSSYCQ